MTLQVVKPRTSDDWIPTFTGRRFYPLDPRVDDVCIEDIAHGLANTGRYCGQCPTLYTVAQHSVLVAETVAASLDAAADRTVPSMMRSEIHRGVVRWALLHDAPEAYLHDITRPVKKSKVFGAEYAKAEDRLMRVIAERFNLVGALPELVGWADDMVTATELRDFFPGQARLWVNDADPLPEKIVPWLPVQAEAMFLTIFKAGVVEVRHV